jgi:pyridoxal phosphate enzyme (YggS family)
MNEERYQDIVKEIKPYGARLVAVSKTRPAADIEALYKLGQRIFGENKAQEMIEKYEVLPKDIDWHLIGHLQTNKVKYVAPFVSLIYSVDSLRLLEEIDRQAQKHSRIIPCLLQMHIAQEETKFGLDKEELKNLLDSPAYKSLKNIQINGFMGMATNTENIAQIEKEFEGLKELFNQTKETHFKDQAHFAELSMGMSSDYKIAIKHGATLIRIGSDIFGRRN